MSKSKFDLFSFLDEDNTITRGVKRGSGWAMVFKSSPLLVWGVRIILFILLFWLIARGLGLI